MGGEVDIPGLDEAPTRHRRLIQWVRDIAALTKPDRVHWCDGSDDEWEALTGRLADLPPGTAVRIELDKAPVALAD